MRICRGKLICRYWCRNFNMIPNSTGCSARFNLGFTSFVAALWSGFCTRQLVRKGSNLTGADKEIKGQHERPQLGGLPFHCIAAIEWRSLLFQFLCCILSSIQITFIDVSGHVRAHLYVYVYVCMCVKITSFSNTSSLAEAIKIMIMIIVTSIAKATRVRDAIISIIIKI